MPRKVRAAGCMVNTLSTNLTGHYRGLWITDALLAETFRNFCHSPRRYGSNVPGPLEARRRASKRKNTNLACVGGGLPVYDPAVMLGSGSKDQWWKRIENKTVTEERVGEPKQDQELDSISSSLLPTWLFKSTISAPAPSILLHRSTGKERQVQRGGFTEVEDGQRDDNIQHLFKARIARCTDLESIQSVVECLQINLRQYPALSEHIFRQLLRSCSHRNYFDKLTPALVDPLLHPPGSSNHLLCLQHLARIQVTRKSWEVYVFPAILKAVELGLVPVADIPVIIQLIPKVRITTSLSRSWSKVYAEWHRILSAIEQSSILRVEDLDSGFLASWYAQINNDSQTDTTCLLLWRLRRYSGLSELELASDLTIRRLSDLVVAEASASEKLISWFTNLPASLRGPAIIQATFKMIAAINCNSRLAQETLEKWSSMLPQLRSDDLQDFPVDKAAWLKASVVPCDLTSPQQLLAIIWLVTRLWSNRPDMATRFANTNLRDDFEHAFANMGTANPFDHVSRVVMTLDTLPLPEKGQIFSFLQHFTEESLIIMLGFREHLPAFRACFKLEYAQLRDNDFTWEARRKFPQVLKALAESINSDLPQFYAMAQILILKSNDNFRIVRHLLGFNMDLKMALLRNWQDTIGDCESEPFQANVDAATLLNMIERLTMTFAVTPVISPKASFRQVYKMYLYLHKVGAPVNPIIARALWHAGVTRYGQIGAPRAQVLWCLSKVREIEGPEAANRLLWSAGFRKNFIKEYVQQLGDDIFMPAMPGLVTPQKGT